MRVEDLEVKGYYLEKEGKYGAPREVSLDRYQQIEGPDKWAVVRGSCVLNTRGTHFAIQPQPSSRTGSFLKRYRFDTPEQAIAAYLKFKSNEEATIE